MFRLIFGNLFGLKKSIDELATLDGTQYFYESFQKSLLGSIKKCKSDIYIEDKHLIVQLQTLFRNSSNRKRIKEFFVIEFDSISSFNQLIADNKGIEGLAELLIRIVEEYNSKVGERLALYPELTQKIIKLALQNFPALLLQNLSVKQAAAVQIFQGIDNAKVIALVTERLEYYGAKLVSGQEDILDNQEVLKSDLAALKQMMQQQITSFSTQNRDAVVQSDLIPFFKKIIDSAREDLKLYNPQKAIEKLDLLEENIQNIEFDKDIILAEINSLLAHSYLFLKIPESSAKYRIKAAKLDPSNIDYLYRASNGYFFFNQIEKIEELVLEIEKIKSGANQSVALALLLRKNLSSIGEALQGLEEDNLESLEVSYALHRIAQGTDEYDKEIFYIKKALSFSPDNIFLRKDLADTLFHAFHDKTSPFLTHKLTEEAKVKLLESLSIYEELWKVFRDTSIKIQNVDLLVKMGILNFLLGNLKSGFEQINEAVSIAPEPELDYVKFQKLLMLIESGRTKAALTLSNEIDLNKIPDAELLVAVLHNNTGANEQSIASLEKYLQNEVDIRKRSDAQRLLVQGYLGNGDVEKAKILFEEYRKGTVSNENLLYLQAVIITKEKKENLTDELDKIREFLTPESEIRDLMDFADSYYFNRKWKRAIDIYKLCVDRVNSLNFLFHYVNSHFKLGEWQKVIDLCRSTNFYENFDESFAFLEMTALARLERHDEALTIGNNLIQAEPNNNHYKIETAKILVLSGDRSDANEMLLSIPSHTLTKHNYEDIISIYGEHRDIEACLSWAFKYRNTINDADAHNRYWQVMTFWVGDKGNLCKTPEKVIHGTAIEIETEGGKKITYLLIGKSESIGKDTILTPSHRIYDRILGEEKGAFFLWDKNEVEEEFGEILSIRTKWVHAYHETIDVLEREYPDKKLFRTLKNGIESIEKMLSFREQKVTEVEEFIENSIPYFQKGVVPISVFATKLGLSIIETYELCKANPKLGIKCNIGNPNQDQISIEALPIAEKNGLCADTTGMLTLYNLKLGEVVRETFGRIKITPSVYNNVELAFAKAEVRKERDTFSVFKKDGITYKDEPSLESKKERFKHFKSLKEWIKDYCVVLPVEYDFENNSKNKMLIGLLGDSTLDTIQLSQENDAVLFSDDLPVRFIAAQNNAVQTLWIMPLLGYLEKKGKISVVEYFGHQVTLMNDNYGFISFGVETLLTALNRNFKAFEKIAARFKAPDCTFDSALLIALEFLFVLWAVPEFNHKLKKAATVIICQGLTDGRKKDIMYASLCYQIYYSNVLETEIKKELYDTVGSWANLQGVDYKSISRHIAMFLKSAPKKLE